MKAHEIASSASNLVSGERQNQHGDKKENMSKIAVLFNAWLAIRTDPAAPLDAHDVAQMMSLMKKARTQSGSFNLDDYVDDVGYTAIAGEVAG